MTLIEANERIGCKVRYTKNVCEVIPDRGNGEIVATSNTYVFVKWNKALNACYPEDIEIDGGAIHDNP